MKIYQCVVNQSSENALIKTLFPPLVGFPPHAQVSQDGSAFPEPIENNRRKAVTQIYDPVPGKPYYSDLTFKNVFFQNHLKL